MIAAEVALSLVLLTVAGLLVHSFSRLYEVQPGVRINNTLTMGTSLAGPGFGTGLNGRRRSASSETGCAPYRSRLRWTDVLCSADRSMQHLVLLYRRATVRSGQVFCRSGAERRSGVFCSGGDSAASRTDVHPL